MNILLLNLSLLLDPEVERISVTKCVRKAQSQNCLSLYVQTFPNTNRIDQGKEDDSTLSTLAGQCMKLFSVTAGINTAQN